MNITLVVWVLCSSAILAFFLSIMINIDNPKPIGIALFIIFVPLFFCLYEIDKTNKKTSTNNNVEVVNE